MTNQILEMAQEGLVLALSTKINPALSEILRAEASHSVDFYRQVINLLTETEEVKNG